MGFFNRNKEEIEDLKLENDKLYGEIGDLKKEIREVRDGLIDDMKRFEKRIDEFDDFFKEYLETSINNVIKDVTDKTFVFDERLLEIEEKLTLAEPEQTEPEHMYEINGSYAVPYKEVKLSGKTLVSHKKKYGFNIEDVIAIKSNLQDYYNEGVSVRAIGKLHNISFDGIYRLVWNIEEGNFDKVIDEYLGRNVNNEEVEQNKYHIFELKKSYHKPYVNLQVGHGGELYSSNNQRLVFTVQDVMEIKDRIYSNRYGNLNDLKEGFEFSRQNFNRIVWNIEEGYFDKVIDEYTSRNYTYEDKFNNLYIDGENTGLTIEKCKLIVDCVINENNKQECVTRLIKNYPNTKPKYIRILAEEYNNANLGKVLSKEVKKVEKVDNPQKRRELGVY